MLFLLAAMGACMNEAQTVAPAPTTVVVGTPVQQEVVDWDDYAGRFEAVDSVEVRPRVSGPIQSVHFSDGEIVREGQLLFVIDPRPYSALLSQARARLLGAKAALANANSELARARLLVVSHAISEARKEALVAAQLRAESDLAEAQATVEAQQLNLSFTQVTAPITGRASYRRPAIGNMVIAGSTLLTTLVSEDPIHFVFDVPESALLKYKRQGAVARQGKVEIRLEDEAQYRWSGTIDFIDNVVDRASGTIRARAVIANPTGFITPGMFGRLRLVVSPPYDALLLPDRAIITDQTRHVVYVVGQDGVVAQKVVEPGQLFKGLRVIRTGVSPQDRVVIGGMQRVRPGQRVAASEGEISMARAGESSSFQSAILHDENTSSLAGHDGAP